jgi:hypothetical protein
MCRPRCLFLLLVCYAGYLQIRYCRLLEEGLFRGRAADLFFMLIIGASLMTILVTTVVTFRKIKFLGHPLSFMMVSTQKWSHHSPRHFEEHCNIFEIIYILTDSTFFGAIHRCTSGVGHLRTRMCKWASWGCSPSVLPTCRGCCSCSLCSSETP